MKRTDKNDKEFVEKAFIEGAKWADNSPKSPWISIEDDLPCNHEELITTNGRYEKNTIYVITIDKYNNFFKKAGEWFRLLF